MGLGKYSNGDPSTYVPVGFHEIPMQMTKSSSVCLFSMFDFCASHTNALETPDMDHLQGVIRLHAHIQSVELIIRQL